MLIHWTGKGYLAIVAPVATAAASTALNEYMFDGRLSSGQLSGPSFVLSALILQYVIRRFPSLRMREDRVAGATEPKTRSLYVVKVEPTFDRVVRFLKVKRYAPHTFFWVPLSAYPFIWGGIGIAQMLLPR